MDTSELLPGDLILTRSVAPDYVSRRITEAQLRGGLASRHAQWTHAAVYLGDGEHICEASFKEPGFRWGVNIRSIFEYCNNEFAIRARRPKGLDDRQRIRIAVGAMANIGKRYSFREILKFRQAAAKGSFWGPGTRQSINPNALVCSTLYQDAYNFSYQGMTLRMGMLCTPAHLSASTDFESTDPSLGWLEIQD